MSVAADPTRSTAAPAGSSRLSRTIALGASLAIFAAVAASLALTWTMWRQTAETNFAENATGQTALLARDMGGAVKFGKADILAEQFEAFITSKADSVSGVLIVGLDGSELVALGDAASLAALAADALSAAPEAPTPEGEVVLSAEAGQAIVVRFGKNDTVVGALAIGWSDAATLRIVDAAALRAAGVGLGVALLLGLAAAIALSRTLSRPLNRLGASVSQLLAGERVDIVGRGRKDEIGALARALGDIHAAGARAAQVENALAASSARLAIAGPDGRLVFASPALEAALRTESDSLRSGGATVDPSALNEAALTDLFPDGSAAEGWLGDLDAPRVEEVRYGELRVDLVASPVRSAEGERLGVVLEWRDRTTELRLQAGVDRVADALSRGDFSERMEAPQGSEPEAVQERRIAAKVNEVAETMNGFVRELGDATRALADGDLTHRLHGSYAGGFGAVADSVSAALEGLSAMVADVKRSERSISASVEQVQTGSVDLSGRAESQAASLEETAAGMEEIASSIKTTAENAAQANALSSAARDRAQSGQEVVSRAVAAMGEIEESSRRVTDIISVIDGIAFQTNLLALNAAVEAARAGEAGKGFAVVASEVRSLAQRCAEAASDIGGLIAASAAKVTDGVSLVNATGDELERILESIEQVSGTVADISEAAGQQSSGVAEINSAVSEMDGMTQKNAALAEQSASAAAALGREVEALASGVARFRTGDADPAFSDVA